MNVFLLVILSICNTVVYINNISNTSAGDLLHETKIEEKISEKNDLNEIAFQWLKPYDGKWKINDIFAYFFLYDIDNPEYDGTVLCEDDPYVGEEIEIDSENKKIVFKGNNFVDVHHSEEIPLKRAIVERMIFSYDSRVLGYLLMKEICGDDSTIKYISMGFNNGGDKEYFVLIITPKGEIMFSNLMGTYKLKRE